MTGSCSRHLSHWEVAANSTLGPFCDPPMIHPPSTDPPEDKPKFQVFNSSSVVPSSRACGPLDCQTASFEKVESTHLFASTVKSSQRNSSQPYPACPSAFLYYSTSCSRQNLFSSSTLFDLLIIALLLPSLFCTATSDVSLYCNCTPSTFSMLPVSDCPF